MSDAAPVHVDILTNEYELDGHVYDHFSLRTNLFSSKEEAQKLLYDSMFNLLMYNRWKDISWRVFPEFEQHVDFVSNSKGWLGYARFSGKR